MLIRKKSLFAPLFVFLIMFIFLASSTIAETYYFIAPEPNCNYNRVLAEPSVLVLHETYAPHDQSQWYVDFTLERVAYRNQNDPQPSSIVTDRETASAINSFTSPERKASTHMVVSRKGDIFLAMNSQRELLIDKQTRCIHAVSGNEFFGVEFASHGELSEEQKNSLNQAMNIFMTAGVTKFITHKQVTEAFKVASGHGDGEPVRAAMMNTGFSSYLVETSKVAELAPSNVAPVVTPGTASAKVIAKPKAQPVLEGTTIETSLPSSSISSGVSCLNTQQCNEIDDVWKLLGNFIRGSSDVWDPTILPKQWRKLGAVRPSVSVGTLSGACPENMANIDNKYCIDKWEDSIYNKNNPSEQASLYYPAKTSQANLLYNAWKNGYTGAKTRTKYELSRINQNYLQMPERGAEMNDGFAPLAVSKQGVIPNMYASQEIAALACTNAGKRLCTEEEWVKACQGPSATQYPYGNEYVAEKCNTNRAGKYPPSIVGWDKVILADDYDPSDPRNGKAAVDIAGVKETGSFSECSNAYGVYDMVGNLAEAVSTLSSGGGALFKGSAFMRGGNNLNCNNNIGAHSTTYTDFSFGFRCCADFTGLKAEAQLSSSNAAAKKLYQDLLPKINNVNLVKAMVANAMDESVLNPESAGDCSQDLPNGGLPISSKGTCCSFGLWQYNICGGLGSVFLTENGSPATNEGKLAVLYDYSKQVNFMVKYLTVINQKYAQEITAQKSVDEWVSWFVTNIERPKNPQKEINDRQKIAQEFEAAGVFS